MSTPLLRVATSRQPTRILRPKKKKLSSQKLSQTCPDRTSCAVPSRSDNEKAHKAPTVEQQQKLQALVNNILEKAQKTFARVKVFHASKPDNFSYVMTLVDTGCGIEMPIVREDIFRKVSRNGHLEDGNPDLAGAEDSPLHIVGRSKKPLRLQFFNQMGEKINYFCRPLVSKNLKLPFILSAGDMIELDLIPRLKTSTATIEYQGSKIKIPLLKLKD